jgi:hypothetical protein
MIAMHIDDFLHAGTADFDNKVMAKLRQRFIPERVEGSKFKYTGFEITQTGQGITMSQDEYVRKLVVPTVTADRAKEKDSPFLVSPGNCAVPLEL